MCGIAGIWRPEQHGDALAQRLHAMAAQLVHRGPDERGIYVGESIGLAHRRLSIIDPGCGQQPMRTPDAALVVSFNGEIFNYIELRDELSALGWRFVTRSDTEVILAAWHCWGSDCLKRFNGQFALALWDAARRTLLLARDHAGIHPLFVTRQGGELLFASEVKALASAMHHTLQPDYQALDEIFTFWSPLPPRTGFAGIEQLAPGECLELSPVGERRWQFFDWHYPDAGHERIAPPQQLADELRTHLQDAVRLRLRADVPVGCYLSGGLDSSAITALVAQQTTALRSFSVNFEDADVDEAPWQQLLHTHLGIYHQAVTVSNEQIAASLPRAVWHTERPLLRTAPVPMLLLSQQVAHQGIKVVLTGEGADEVLCGYDLFKEAKVRQFWARQQGSAWRWTLLRRLYPWMDLASVNYLKRFFGEDLSSASHLLFSHFPRWRTAAQCKQFYSEGMRTLAIPEAILSAERWMPSQAEQWHPQHRAQYLESRLLMDTYLLSSQGDRMLMANGVEGRFPFLDPDLVRFANALAPRSKMPGLNEKALLKQAVRDLLPATIVSRPKQPYRAPGVEQLLHGDYAGQLLSESALMRAGYFDPARVALLQRKALAGKLPTARDQMALTAVVSTQLWHQQFIEGKALTIGAAA